MQSNEETEKKISELFYSIVQANREHKQALDKVQELRRKLTNAKEGVFDSVSEICSGDSEMITAVNKALGRGVCCGEFSIHLNAEEDGIDIYRSPVFVNEIFGKKEL
ncbi:hypothetical protein [Agarivorans sp. B2Z047]|uniref:hypothetical protein n=2 Tax=Agarivorans sp. B2Z047 TaxID=2652721 RepID=UPI00201A1842|nr:hypothetical protein [Agarivorans sp. B2Z047]UQN41916.1 hypothetical protein LQZ07_19370 [Agarivorans sp. B2Z047]